LELLHPVYIPGYAAGRITSEYNLDPGVGINRNRIARAGRIKIEVSTLNVQARIARGILEIHKPSPTADLLK